MYCFGLYLHWKLVRYKQAVQKVVMNLTKPVCKSQLGQIRTEGRESHTHVRIPSEQSWLNKPLDFDLSEHLDQWFPSSLSSRSSSLSPRLSSPSSSSPLSSFLTLLLPLNEADEQRSLEKKVIGGRIFALRVMSVHACWSSHKVMEGIGGCNRVRKCCYMGCLLPSVWRRYVSESLWDRRGAYRRVGRNCRS